MTRKFSDILEEARALPYAERGELIDRLIEDSVKAVDPKIEKIWSDEALRRFKEIEEGNVQMIPGDDVMATARRIIGRQ
ncbi:MAG: addiction module protein [Opitutaceae bacterium]